MTGARGRAVGVQGVGRATRRGSLFVAPPPSNQPGRRDLACARDRGVGLVCIGSEPGISTERNARRLGFSVAYTKAVLVMRREGLARSV